MSTDALKIANEKLLRLRRQYRYGQYLRSYKWKEKRYRVYRRAGYMCEACGKNPAIAVHHLHYPKRWGDEPLSWLQAVCASCHDGLHDYETREQVREMQL